MKTVKRDNSLTLNTYVLMFIYFFSCLPLLFIERDAKYIAFYIPFHYST